MAFTIQDLIENTNFNDLREQKSALLAAMSSLHAIGGDSEMQQAEKLDGLLSFLDAFQDMCVDTYGVDEKEVFNFSTDDE